MKKSYSLTDYHKQNCKETCSFETRADSETSPILSFPVSIQSEEPSLIMVEAMTRVFIETYMEQLHEQALMPGMENGCQILPFTSLEKLSDKLLLLRKKS